MSQNKFTGIAYWTVQTQSADWLIRAQGVLKPLQEVGLAEVVHQADTLGDHLIVSLDGEEHRMLVNQGAGRGVVRCTASATMFVVCLVALRRALGDIKLVNDSQEIIAPTPRQSDPLYAADWLRVKPIAQELGLIVSSSFAEQHKSIFQKMF